MTNLSDYLLVDTTTGTVLNPESCVLIPETALSEAEWEALDNSADSDVCAIGLAHGTPLSKSEQLLHSIADALWGEGADTEWCPDTTQAIADAIQVERPDLAASRI